MKNLLRFATTAVVALTLTAMPWVKAFGQTPAKPVAVVSIAGIQKIMGDITYLTQAAGVPDMGGLATMMAGQFIDGLDQQRPSGVLVTLDPQSMQPTGVGFLPVSDFQKLMKTVEEKSGFGPAEDVDGGVKSLGGMVFVKESNGWAYVSDKAENLAQVPADPAALLGGLDQQFEVAVRLYVQNIPAQLRGMAVEQLKAGMEAGMAQGAGGDFDQELAEKISRNSLNSIVTAIEETDQLTIGWAVNAQAQKTFLEMQLTAVPGSNLAKAMAAMSDNRSSFGGFLLPEAAATFHSTSAMAPEDIQQLSVMMQAVRTKALQEIDGDASLPNEQAREAIKQLLASVMDVGEKTIQAGKIDMGGAVMLGPGSVTFAVGGQIADGPALEAAFKKLIELTKSEPDVPDVAFNADSHGGVSFHSFSVPIPGHEEEARQLLGDNLEVIVGTGAESIYLALGKDGNALLKKIIDKSAADANKQVPPLRMSIALSSVMEFVSNMEGNEQLAGMAAALKQTGGSDHILVTAKVIQNGLAYRIEVEDGVLKLIGQAAQMGAGAGGPGF